MHKIYQLIQIDPYMKHTDMLYLSTTKSLAIILIVSMIMWAFGLPTFIHMAQAASLTSVSDTLSESAPSTGSNHSIAFTTVTDVAATETIKIQFDPTADAFDLGTLTNPDISATGMTVVAACGGGSDEVTISIDSTAPDENITLTVCSGDTVTAGAKTVTVSNTKIVNPSSEGSYVISIGGTMTDSADTRVAIVNNVTVTAAVDTTLTFVVSGVANGQTVNGDAVTTATTTTATTLPFETLSDGVAKTLAQDLSVTTNAANGFVVTVSADQALSSATGADIDTFIDGADTATPVAWQAPAGTLGTENTYGHMGITSEDSDLNSDEFGSALYAGDYVANAREVFSHTGPADGSTADQGATRVGFKAEIDALQEAGNDYTATLTYVATPTF